MRINKTLHKAFPFFCYASARVSLLLQLVSPVKLVTVKESSIKAKSPKMQRNFLRSFCLFWFWSLLNVYKISRVCRGKRRVEHTHSFCHACSDKIPTCFAYSIKIRAIQALFLFQTYLTAKFCSKSLYSAL